MLKLKNVSKFYYSKGVVASGFSKINLNLDIGEFVVITGESGSGKSTLLNVISGLDSYEEGEMYVNGEETSHYNENDFEDYRRKYIGNIFQHFNLVNSYTVYQNIELVLLLNGHKKKEIKSKILEIIKEVELSKYKNTKVSKLSGGQKQRVAIARALAKDTPIIVADEPTGNLDSRSADGVLKILHKVSQGKLVVIVTHNYEQVEEYATRKIKMHDGRIIEDKVIKKTKEKENIKEIDYQNITRSNRIRLAFRNTFNIIPKFILLFLVYFFIVLVVTSQYTSMQKRDGVFDGIGYSTYFGNTDEKRIIVKKNNNMAFSEEDFKKIANLSNIDNIVKDDILLDMNIMVNDNEETWLYGNAKVINTFVGGVDLGKTPEKPNEAIVSGTSLDWRFGEGKDSILEKEFFVNIDGSAKNGFSNTKIKIVGIKFNDNTLDYSFYVDNSILDSLRGQNNQRYSTLEMTINKKIYKSDNWDSGFVYTIVPNDKVPRGKAYFPEEFNYICKNLSCLNSTFSIKVKNIYYEDNIKLKVSKTYTPKTYAKLTGLDKSFNDATTIFISASDYNDLFITDTYQSSVFVKNIALVDDTIKELKKMDLKTLYVKNTIVNPFSGEEEIFAIFRVIVAAVVIVGLFFISYFIIRLILKSRNVYFSTMRILGASKKISKQLLNMEMITIVNLAYIVFLVLVVLVKQEIIEFKYVMDLTTYLKVYDYVIVYAILIVMSLLISHKFTKKLFKDSAMIAYREEV